MQCIDLFEATNVGGFSLLDQNKPEKKILTAFLKTFLWFLCPLEKFLNFCKVNSVTQVALNFIKL